MNNTVTVREVLRGKHLTFISALYDPAWLAEDDDGVQSGFHKELMDRLSIYAGFTYKIITHPLSAFDGMSWTEYLDIATRKSDGHLEYWLQTPTRSSLGIRSACKFCF